MIVKKVEWKQLGRDMQFLREIALTLSDGTVLRTADEQKPLFRGEDLVFIDSRNVPTELQYVGKYSNPEQWTDNLEIVGLVSEFLHAQKSGNFEEKVETR